MEQPRRILIVNPFGIGDVLFTTPLVRAMREAFPESRLGYLCNRRTESILLNNPCLDELFVYEKDELIKLWRLSPYDCLVQVGRLIRRIRRSHFDLVIDLSLGDRYGLILRMLGVPRRVGFAYRHRGRFLSESLPMDGYHDQHVVTYYEQLLHFVGIHLREHALELRTSDEDSNWASEWMQEYGVDSQRPRVGIIPAGGVSWGTEAPFRRWSTEGFAAVADSLAERFGAQIVLFGERSDAPICSSMQQRMSWPAINISGQTTLTQFIALLARLDLVICNDGGPLHLAVSQGVRTVSIFGPVDPEVYGPYPLSYADHRIIYQPQLLCRPCYHRFRLPPCPYERACLTTIDPQEVIEACCALLEERSARQVSV